MSSPEAYRQRNRTSVHSYRYPRRRICASGGTYRSNPLGKIINSNLLFGTVTWSYRCTHLKIEVQLTAAGQTGTHWLLSRRQEHVKRLIRLIKFELRVSCTSFYAGRSISHQCWRAVLDASPKPHPCLLRQVKSSCRLRGQVFGAFCAEE